MDHMGAAMNGTRKLIEKRDRYRQELAHRTNQHTHASDFMAEVYQKLLEDVERQLDNKKE